MLVRLKLLYMCMGVREYVRHENEKKNHHSSDQLTQKQFCSTKLIKYTRDYAP